MRGDLQINFKLLHNLILHVQCCIHIFGKALCLRGNLRKFLACAEIFQMPRTIPVYASSKSKLEEVTLMDESSKSNLKKVTLMYASSKSNLKKVTLMDGS